MGEEQPDSGPGKIGLEDLPIALISSRPALLTSSAELDIIRGRLQDAAYVPLYEAVMRLARSNMADVTSPQAAAADVDPRHFDIGWQLLGLESVLPAAGVLWRITGDNSYLNRALELLDTALEWPRWSDGRHLVVNGYYNAAPETASGMRAFAWGLDLFSGGLPADVERMCQRKLALLTQRLTEISVEGSVRWAANPFDDWSADIHSAIGHAALALYEVDDRAQNWLKHALTRILAYLDCLPVDGGHPSGISRWEFALTHCCTFIEALYRTSGLDFRHHPAIERTRRFAVRCLAPGGQDIVQIDQGLPLRISNVTRGPLSKLLAKWFEDPVIGWALFNTPEQTNIEVQDLLWFDDAIPQTAPDEAGEGSAAFPDIGWAVMRSGWSSNDHMVAFRCTPYWPGYHHLDQGTFEVFVKGREMVPDSGLGWRAHPNYFDRYRDSLAHNVILVDGEGQLRHSEETHGEMKGIKMSEHADYAVGECSGAYENVKRFTRAILFLKPDVVVIHDIIELDRPRSIEWLMHGGGNFEVQIHAQDRGFSLKTDDAGIEGFVLQPGKWKHTLRRGYKLADWQTRHEVTHPVLAILPDKSTNVEFLIALKLGDSQQPREFPGRVAPDGALLLRAGNNNWSVRPSDDGIEYKMASKSAVTGS